MSGERKIRFACTHCGNCCRIPGYVRLTDEDVVRIAAHLGMTEEGFTREHTRLTEDRQGLSLIEREDGACAFLSEDNRCTIHAVKPAQCVGFPFNWRYRDVHLICEGWHDEEE